MKPSKLRVAGLFGGEIHRWHKGPVTRKMFPFDDVIMNNIISNHFVNHKLSYNEISVPRWKTAVHESSQCKYMCSRATARDIS